MLKNHYQRLTVLLFLLAVGYVSLYLLYNNFYSSVFSYDIISVGTTPLNSCIILDNVSLSFSAIVMYISGCVFFFARYYMAADVFYYRFMWILLSFVAAMNVLILSGSLFILLVGWDGLGVSSFALIMYYQSKESLIASFLTLLINRLGDIVIMSSMVVIVMMGSSFLVNYLPTFGFSMMALYALAASTKSAQYPFCAWLPAAMAAPTPVSALVHSSTLVTAGVFILIRSCTSNSMPMEVCSMLLFFGSVTSFIGGSCAIYENDLKKLIALSTLSQLGVMVFSLGLGAHMLALLHLFTHAMFKALLFLVAGCVLLLSFGVQDIRLLGSVTKNNPLLLVFLNVSALCLMGFPFLSAFYSKHLILSVMWSQNINMLSLFLMLLSIFLSSAYMMRLLKMLNWGPVNTIVTNVPESGITFYSPLFLLFVGSLSLGWFVSAMDATFVHNTFTPSLYDVVLYLITFAGVFYGLMMRKMQGNKMLSTMYYMVPTWYNINFLTYHFVSSLKCLDSGWLEPHSYKNSFMAIPGVLSMNSSWPKQHLSFMPYLILSLGSGWSLWWLLN